MTYQFKLNVTPQNGCDAIFQWKQFMVAHEWSVKASSDGYSTYSGSSDVITSAAPPGFTGTNQNPTVVPTPGSLLWHGAWFVIEQPGTTRQFLFQTQVTAGIQLNPILSGNVVIGYGPPTPSISNDNKWLVQYSSTGFSNGGSITTIPTASNSSITGQPDMGIVANDKIFGNLGTYRMQIGMDDAAPNTFYWFCTVIPTNSMSSGFYFDSFATSTFPVADTDPYVIHWGLSNFASTASVSQINAGGPFGFMNKGIAGEAFTNIAATTYVTNTLTGSPLTTVVANLPSNPYNNTDDLLPIIYARPYSFNSANTGLNLLTTPAAYRGVSNAFKWCVTQRQTLELLAVVNPGDKIMAGNMAFPWNGNGVSVTSPIV